FANRVSERIKILTQVRQSQKFNGGSDVGARVAVEEHGSVGSEGILLVTLLKEAEHDKRVTQTASTACRCLAGRSNGFRGVIALRDGGEDVELNRRGQGSRFLVGQDRPEEAHWCRLTSRSGSRLNSAWISCHSYPLFGKS